MYMALGVAWLSISKNHRCSATPCTPSNSTREVRRSRSSVANERSRFSTRTRRTLQTLPWPWTVTNSSAPSRRRATTCTKLKRS